MKKLSFFLIPLSIVFIISCNSKTSNDSSKDKATAVEETSALCMWNNLSMRATPNEKGKFLTSLNMGETMIYLDSTVTDESSSKKHQYAKVKLSDNTEGWVRNDLIIIDAKLAVITDKASICKRADLITKTDKSFEAMDIVAVKSTSSGLANVKGIIKGGTWYSEGWISEGLLSYKKPDITAAILISRALSMKDTEERINELGKIYNEELDEYSVFREVIEELMLGDPATLLKEENYKLFNCWFSIQGEYEFNDEGEQVSIDGVKFGNYYWNLMSGAYMLSYCVNENDEGTNDVNRALKNLSGKEIYTRSRVDYDVKFNYLNPEFVKWATNTLIPHPNNDFLGIKSSKVYKVVLRDQVRLMANSYWVFKNDYPSLTDGYIGNVLDGEEDGINFLYETIDESHQNDGLIWLIGFWARRDIDGSIDEIWIGLKKVLLLYDKEWYDRSKN